MFTRSMVICGLLLAAGIGPGTRALAQTGQHAAARPLVSTKLSDVVARAIDHGGINAAPVQGAGCPWDCGDNPPDGNVGIVDFLALLAEWDMVGTPCDFDGGGVGIVDFLKLLANWGPCPAPANDECVDKIIIDRMTSDAVVIEPFDMAGATASPEPSLCTFQDPNLFQDTWYCLQNNSGEDKIVTLTSDVAVLAEVTVGCICPPGPLVACGSLAGGGAVFNMAAGEQVCIRLINDIGLPNDQLNGELVITNEPATPASCPWDCGDTPPDGLVGIVDFLALLAEWGLVDTPCDFDGGGVGIVDFLKLLANWGQCPDQPDPPANDECLDKITIDRMTSDATVIEPFDMAEATASPEPGQCEIQDPNLSQDIWYCLQNNSGEDKVVTLSSDVDVLAEVTEGCTCPPGPLVQCGSLAGVGATFSMTAGQQVCIRLINNLDLPDGQLSGDLVISNEPTDQINFFLNQGQFFNAVGQAGKDLKLDWNFNPHFQSPASEVAVPDPLDINTHASNPSDPWSLAPGEKCFDQQPNQINGLFSDVNCDSCTGDTQVVADQIVLTTAESLAVLQFWGGYFPGDGGGGDPLPDVFTVKIRENDTTMGPDRPGAVIRKIPVGPANTRTETGQILFGVREFEYTIQLDPTQDLEPGTYWVEIYNDTTEDLDGDDWFWEIGDVDPVNGVAGSVFSLDPPNDPSEQWTIDPATDLSLSITCGGGAGEDLWPPQVDNIQFTSNLNPQGPLVVGDNLAFATAVFGQDVLIDMLRETSLTGSINVNSGPPAGDNHTAMAVRITSTLDAPVGSLPVLWHVTVYDKQDVEIGKVTIEASNGFSNFVGFITKDPQVTIGRVDIWDSLGAFEGITRILAYQNLPPGDG